jgi:ubiquinone/menaquinone biosynthesis C-methylase UbiE
MSAPLQSKPADDGFRMRAAARAEVEVTVLEGCAESLPAQDASFECVVCSLVLCSVADQAQALAEARRVPRPGGELRFYEHVASKRPAARALQGALDRARIWPLLAGGCGQPASARRRASYVSNRRSGMSAS